MVGNSSRRFASRVTFSVITILLIGGICLCGYQLCQFFCDGAASPLMASPRLQRATGNGGANDAMPSGSSMSLSLTSEPWKLSVVDSTQRACIKNLMARGQYERALSEAKSYYSVIELAKTKEAVKLMTAVLSKARGHAIAERFRREQTLDSFTSSDTGARREHDDVLQTIKLDSSKYEQAIQRLQNEPENIQSLIGCGNLLLLAGRASDARECFESALQLAVRGKAGKPGKASSALEGIARAIRDEGGSAIQADAFVLSMHRRSSFAASVPIGSVMDRVCTAAEELVPSGIFSGKEIALCQSPEDPSMEASNDPRLASWLADWQKTEFSADYDENRKSELLQLLKDTQLSCLELVGIGRSISFQSSDDWMAAAFYAAASTRGHNELARLAPGSRETRPVLIALNIAKPTLWTVVDSGDRTFIDALYVLNCDLVHWILTSDDVLQHARAHGFIGAAECLWVMGKTEEALRAAELIDTTMMTSEEKRGVAWIRALALLSKGRYSDAIAQLHIVANEPDYKYAEEASRWLAVSLANTGKIGEANDAFDDWVRRYHPNVPDAARVLDLMAPR
jgi:tetratricopeptide (TPR) repeat protein